MGVLFAATGKRAKYDSAPSTLPIGPLLSRKQDKCAYFSASCGGGRDACMCAFWVLIQKILKKDPPFLFFPLVGGGCGNACVCVCACKAFCVDCLSVFACEATKSKNLRWRAPRDGKDDARTHTTHRERESADTTLLH